MHFVQEMGSFLRHIYIQVMGKKVTLLKKEINISL